MMWRIRPLAKMALFMVVLCIPLSIAEHLVYEGWPRFESLPDSVLGYVLRHAIVEGAYWGSTVGIAMVLVTAVLYRRVRKPLLYRFAMVIVATAVTIATQPIPLSDFIIMTERYPNGGIWLLAYLARTILIIMISQMVASVYAAEAARRNPEKAYAEA